MYSNFRIYFKRKKTCLECTSQILLIIFLVQYSTCSCGSGDESGGFHSPEARKMVKKLKDLYASTNSTCSCGSGDGSGGFHSPEARKVVSAMKKIYKDFSRTRVA